MRGVFSTAWRELALVLFSFALLPNLLARIAAHFFFIQRPLVNLDYLFLGIAAPFLRRWQTGLIFAFLLLNEIVDSLAPIYHFAPLDVYHWALSVVYLERTRTLAILLVTIAVLATLSFALVRPIGQKSGRMRLSFLMAALSLALAWAPLPMAYSALGQTFASLAHGSGNPAQGPYARLSMAESATGSLWGDLSLVPPRLPAVNIALVVVESFGQAKDSALMAGILAPLINSAELLDRYDISTLSIPFHGYTFAAEFRELCGIELFSEEVSAPKCLPNILSDFGYQTTAFHGFAGEFYGRKHWYPTIGFAHSFFAEEMQVASEKGKCGTLFRGICDQDVGELMHKTLLSGSRKTPQFAYWMTLNSHLPLDEGSGQGSAFNCEKNRLTKISANICSLSRTIYLVAQSVAEMAADRRLAPTLFIVVGDHSPPFLENFEEAQYSGTEVPAVILTPKPRFSEPLPAGV